MLGVAWTLDLALELVRDVQPHLARAGWHCGITGSVLFEGSSKKDLDLIVYPNDASGPRDLDGMRDALRVGGMKYVRSVDVVHNRWRRLGSTDTKHVEAWGAKGGRRVDVFVLS